MRLDTHQHFWDLANPFTDWPTADLAAIHRDFGPHDLRTCLEAAGVEGTILVQAAPCLDETEYCLRIAAQHDFVKGVVGWIDFEADDALEQLSRLRRNPLVKGLRPMVQSIAQTGWLVRPDFDPIYEAMIRYDLSLDGLVLWHQIDDLTRLAQRHPQLRIVLDHAGKPPISSGNMGPWAAAIFNLALNPNVHCKLSGLWTEASGNVSPEAFRPWIAHLFATFGAMRIMWGSDWPVVELAGRYTAWHSQCEAFLSSLPEAQREAVLGDNGRRFYGIA
jgi:L-fuconolactonase